jgi:hypothetical protein
MKMILLLRKVILRKNVFPRSRHLSVSWPSRKGMSFVNLRDGKVSLSGGRS